MKLIKTEVVDTGGGCMVGIGQFKTHDGKTLYVNVSDDSYSVTETYIMTTDEKERDRIDNQEGIVEADSIDNSIKSDYRWEIAAVVDQYDALDASPRGYVRKKLQEVNRLIGEINRNNKLPSEKWSCDTSVFCEKRIVEIMDNIASDCIDFIDD